MMDATTATALYSLIAIIIAAAVLGSFMTAGLLQYSRSRRIMDVPNHRSSHTQPTPRGGGLAIVALTALCVVGLAVAGWLEFRLAMALLGIVPIATVGWFDDVGHVPARWRAAVHFAAAAWAVYWAGGMSSITLGPMDLKLGPFGSIAAMIGIAWCTNLYNFMDGIDGIAASEAVFVGLVGALLLIVSNQPGLALVPGALAGAAAGFLWWNREPARIFMGDVGSGAIGYAFAVIGLISENAGAVPMLVWVILASVFAVDATITLVRRGARGERWYAAHRDHAYQRAVQAGSSHARVVWAMTALNTILATVAVMAWKWPAVLPFAFLGAVALNVIVYVWVERFSPMRRPPEEQAHANPDAESMTPMVPPR